MNIKSLLLGSAAALVAVSGARAADAVVAPEPEPVEYVRVCDVYGTSFYYIPGTEICLKVGGYLRYDIGFGDLFGDVGDDGDQTYHKRARFQLRMDARTETELGTLRGYAAINFNFATNSASPDPTLSDGWDDSHDAGQSEGIEHAYVELGGFRIGKTDSLFVTETGYASDVVNDGLIAYGPFDTHQIAYTYDFGNGFSISGAVEEGTDGGNYTSYANETSLITGLPVIGDHGAINDYTPHLVLGAAYSGGIWGVSVVGAYDSNQEEFAVKGRLDVHPNDMFALFVMGAWTDDNGDDDPLGGPLGANNNGGNYYATWGGDWAVWAGGSAKFNDRVKANVEFGYNDLEDWSVDADVNLTVVPGFVVTPGVGYTHGDGDPLSYITPGDTWGGYVRTQFTF
jgi:opacity protein-like surface antigen